MILKASRRKHTFSPGYQSRMDEKLQSPDNDSVFGDGSYSISEDMNVTGISSAGGGATTAVHVTRSRMFTASRFESTWVREHRFSSSSSGSSDFVRPRSFTPITTSSGSRGSLFQRRNVKRRGILSPLR